MIIITTIDGKLRIQAEFDIPTAPAGQWAPDRIGRMMELIQHLVMVAEMDDAAIRRAGAAVNSIGVAHPPQKSP